MDLPAPAPAAARHPSGDERFQQLEAAMRRHQLRHDALIEVLHAAQQLFGYLEVDLLYFIARRLMLPPSKVYGVATFYHLFTLQPQGQHTCIVCLGTACYVRGADAVLAAVEERAHIHAGETTPDGALSLRKARCLSTCSGAPLVVLDGQVRRQETPARLLAALKGWLPHGSG